MAAPRTTRRRFLRDAAAATAASGALATPAAARPARRRRAGRSVAVLGGGVAGLTAAHELAERGFEVTVFERKALGGKARSIPVPRTARGGRRELPGEHGFRFFPGFYHHVPDTMRRIPFPGNPNGVYDNLVAANGVTFARDGGREDLILGAPEPFDVKGVREVLLGAFGQITRLPPQELEYFVRRLEIFLTSSDERRFGQWEYVSWWDYVKAADKSEEYKRMLAIGLTRNLVAAKAELASSRTIGYMAEAFLYNIMGRGNDGEPDRLLNAPTNEAWIDPWVAHLKKLGVRFRLGQTVRALDLRRGRIAGAVLVDRRGRRRRIEADWFVSAMPVERARRLWTPAILRADPRLARMRELKTAWMNGIQFYLRRKVPIFNGHLSYVDSQWALTSVSQAQFWAGRDFPRDYGDGQVRDCLSVDISDFEAPGMLYGKPASQCTPAQIAREVWAQIKAHIEDTGRSYLPDDVLHSWFLDPAIAYPPRRRGRASNDEPLLINTIGSWDKRPSAATRMPNFFLASDYVQDNIDLATMEGANETARLAVIALLEAAGSRTTPPRLYKLYRPPEFEAAKALDAERFKRGEPHALDA